MWRSLLTAMIGLMMVSKAYAADPENTLYMDLKDGRVVIEMYPEKAPKHVARIKELVRKGFYDGLVFHRVIDSFMAQTGDPTGTGSGGSGQNIKAEFNDIKHDRGTLSMARAASPDSADSQFFIVFEAATHLDGQYTAWGKVVSGMEFVDKIKKGDPYRNGTVTDPDKIVKLQVAADVKESAPAAPAAGGVEPTASGSAPVTGAAPTAMPTASATPPGGTLPVVPAMDATAPANAPAAAPVPAPVPTAPAEAAPVAQ